MEVFESWDGIGIDEWCVAGFVEMESGCAALVCAESSGKEEKDARNKSIKGTIRNVEDHD